MLYMKCDGCGVYAPAPKRGAAEVQDKPTGWVTVMMSAGRLPSAQKLFCSPGCVADWANPLDTRPREVAECCAGGHR